MADTDVFSDQEILARTLFGEARGEGFYGLMAVANVIINRAKSRITWWGHDVRSVCLAPYQFSCWNESDPNRSLIMAITAGTDPIYNECLTIANAALNGILRDNTNSATSYYARSMPNPPEWAAGKTEVAEVGNHVFFSV
jgi:spore germination cell wall hydrolase CwlJ-like protein